MEKPQIIFAEYQPVLDCKNPETCGMLCLHCGEGGREFEGGVMVKNAPARIITLEELMGAELGMDVYLDILGTGGGIQEDTYIDLIDDNRIGFYGGYIQMTKLYGRQWRCWTATPTEEQRQKEPWDWRFQEGHDDV